MPIRARNRVHHHSQASLQRCACLVLISVLLSSALNGFLQPQAALAFGSPVAAVTLGMPSSASADPFLGETFHFDAVFDNTGAAPDDTGYGPYADLYFPARGYDSNDGITFISATYLDAALTATVLTFDASGQVAHPYAKDNQGQPLVISGTEGDQLVVLLLPFGSFTRDQTPLTLDVTARVSEKADAGQLHTIRAWGGYMFGNDALDNPTIDPSIVGGESSLALRPTVLRLTKEYIGPEDETATGPNFPRQYTISAAMAYSQTLSNLDLTDVLPENIQFLSVEVQTTTLPVSTPSLSDPGGTLTHRFVSIPPENAIAVRQMTVNFYVPEFDLDDAPVIPPASGAAQQSVDDAQAAVDWTPADPRDAGVHLTSNTTPNDHTLADRSLAIQKTSRILTDTGKAGPTPGDVLEYTLAFQVSDYFAFQDVSVQSDVLGDGLLFDPAFTPTLDLHQNGVTTTLPFDASHFILTPPAGGLDGNSELDFYISDQLADGGPGPQLLGGLVADGGSANDGATRGLIRYHAILRDKYVGTGYPGDPSLNQGDLVSNTVTLRGQLLDASTCDTGSCTAYDPAVEVTDGSSETIVIAGGILTKSIYALNGTTAGLPNPVVVTGKDLVTYEFSYRLAFGDFEDMAFTDYLPLPVFKAGDPDANGGPAQMTWAYDADHPIPEVGKWTYGPLDDFHTRVITMTPVVTTHVDANAIQFNYGSYEDLSNTSARIQLLFTVAASTDPFADGLFLTNQVTERDQNTIDDEVVANSIIQVKLSEPKLNIRKGVVATNRAATTYIPSKTGQAGFTAPGSACPRFTPTVNSTLLAANPLDSDASGLEAGDRVTYAVVVENTGSGINGAFDIQVSDVLTTGLAYVAGSLCVQDGSGAALTYTGDDSDFFAAGITLNDSASTGALRAYDPDAGQNLAIITYDAVLTTAAPSGGTLRNTASLTHYAGSEGALNFVPQGLQDSARVSLLSPTLHKAVTSSTNSYTLDPEVAVGEILTYSTVITVPQGTTHSAWLTDTLTGPVVFAGCDSLTPSDAGALTTDQAGFANVCSDAVISGAGKTMALNLGTLTNTDLAPGTPETLTLQYRAVVLNTTTAVRNTALHNRVALSWQTGAGWATTAAQQVSSTVVEPVLSISKTASSAWADAGDPIAFTITVSNPVATQDADAFDVVLNDLVPAGMTLVPGSAALVSGLAPTTPLSAAGVPGTISTGWDRFPVNATSVFSFTVTLDDAVSPRQARTNQAGLTWTSMPGNVLTAQSSQSAFSVERTGTSSDPGELDNYTATGSASVTIDPPVLTKTVAGTSHAHTTGTNVAIGETIDYTVQITVPEGVSGSAYFTDTLPAGLAFVSCDSFTASSGALSSDQGAFATLCAPSAITNTGRTLAFNLGTVTNTDRVDNTPETLTLQYKVVALNVAGNQRGTNLNNAAVWAWNNGTHQNVTANRQVRVVEPEMMVLKSASPTVGDAGDTITYTLTISPLATSNATAFDVTLVDTLPSGLTLDPGSLIQVSGNPAATLLENTGVTRTVEATWAQFPTNQTAILQFSARLDATVKPGDIYTNTARIDWSSLPGDVSASATTHNPNGMERTGSGAGVNDYTDDVQVAVDVIMPQPSKSIVQTSENHTALVGGSERVAVGEIVRYHLAVRIPEGNAPAMEIVDNLPDGLRFLNDGQARLALVTNDAGMSSNLVFTTTLGCDPGLNQVGNTTSLTPSCPLPADAITSTGEDSAAVTFNLGTLTNDDRDADEEYAVVEFNALVDNVASNQAGVALNNTFSVRMNGQAIAGSESSVATAYVAEPALTISKQASSLTVDAGDLLTYTLVIANNATGSNRAAAFDLVITDTLNSYLDLQQVQVTAPSGSSQVLDSTILGPGGTLHVGFDRLSPAEDLTGVKTITLTLSTQALANLPARQIMANTAWVRYTSLPGTGSTSNPTGGVTPGAGGELNGERTGSGLAANDYWTSASAPNVNAALPQIAKSVVGSNFTIGELVNYDLLVTLPEGDTQGLVITDNLPVGMMYESFSLITEAGTTGSQLTQDYSDRGTLAAPAVAPTYTSGGDVVFTFGTLRTAADNVPANNRFQVRVSARVLDDPAQNAGASLSNQAILRYTNPNTGSGATINSNNVSITLVEPRILTTKTVSPSSGVQAGSLLTYTVRFTNNGTSPAYEVSARDTLAVGTSFDHLIGCNLDGDLISPTPQATADGGRVDFDGNPAGSWEIAQNSYLECSYQVWAEEDLTVDGNHQNEINANWRSLPAASSTQERYYNDTQPGYTMDGSQDVARATFSVDPPVLTKTDGGTSDLAVGEVATYWLEIESPLGTLRSLVVTDTLPAGLMYQGSYTVDGLSATTLFTSTAPADGSAPLALAWDFGDAVVTSSPVVISYQALVTNTLLNQIGVTHLNTAGLNYRDVSGAARHQDASDDLSVAEPVITLSKETVTLPGSIEAGDVITYQVTITNTAGAHASTAYDLHLTDLLPSNLELDLLSVTPTPAGLLDTNASTGNLVDLTFSQLDPGSTISVQYSARLKDELEPGDTVQNGADLTWTSRPGADPLERTGAGGLNDYLTAADTTLTANGQPLIEKKLSATSLADTLGSDVTIGEVLTYTLVVTLPEGTLPSLQVVDSIPAGLTVVSGTVSVDATALNGTLPAPLVTPASGLTFTFGPTIVAGDNDPANNYFTVRYAARVQDVPENIGLEPQKDLVNSATVQIGSNPPVAAAPVTVTVVEPLLELSKSFDPPVALVGDLVTVTLSVTNSGTSPAYGAVLEDPLLTAEFTNLAAGPAPAGFDLALVPDGAATRVRYTAQPGRAIEVGERVDFTFQARVAAGVAMNTTLTNTALISAYNTLPAPASGGRPEPQVTAADTLLVGSADLSLNKTAMPGPVIAGMNLTYNLTVTNGGPNPANAITLTDALPLGVSLVSSTGPGWTCSAQGQVVTCTLPDLAVGASSVVDLTVTVAPGFTGTLVNEASVGRTGVDPDPTNNTDDETVTVLTQADLQIVKADLADPVLAAEGVTYRLDVSNQGPSDAGGVQVADTLPPGLVFQSASGPGWTCTHSTGTVGCSRSTLAAGATAPITLTASLPTSYSGTLSNTAVVTSNMGDDPDPSNNQDTETTLVTAVPILEMEKTAGLYEDGNGDGRPNPGETLVYTLTVRNVGSLAASGVVITDTPGAYTSLLAGTVTALPAAAVVHGNTPGDSLVEVQAPDIQPGSSAQVIFRVKLADSLPLEVTQVSNQAVVQGSNFTSLASDDPATPPVGDPTVTPVSSPRLRANKAAYVDLDQDHSGGATPGDTLVYLIEVVNTGNAEALGVVIEDHPDVNTTLVPGSVQTTRGTITLGNGAGDTSVRVELGTLAVNQPVTITLKTRINQNIPAGVVQVANQALAAGDNFQPVDTNDPSTSYPNDPTRVQIAQPTAVTLLYFRAEPLDGWQVRLSWATASEIDNFGFNLYRAPANDFSQAERIGSLPVQPEAGVDGERRYEWTDQLLSDEVWWYWLEDVGLDGTRTLHPMAVTNRLKSTSPGAYLPFIWR